MSTPVGRAHHDAKRSYTPSARRTGLPEAGVGPLWRRLIRSRLGSWRFVGGLRRLLPSLQAAPYLAVELLKERVAALGTLLVVAHHPNLVYREGAQAP